MKGEARHVESTTTTKKIPYGYLDSGSQSVGHHSFWTSKGPFTEVTLDCQNMWILTL